MNNKDYWIKRALSQEQKSKEKGEGFLKDLQKQYKAASLDIEEDIQKWFKKYANENSISISDCLLYTSDAADEL